MRAKEMSRNRAKGVRTTAFAAIAVILLGGGAGVCEAQTVEEVWTERDPESPGPEAMVDRPVDVKAFGEFVYVCGTREVEAGAFKVFVAKYDAADGTKLAEAEWPDNTMELGDLIEAKRMAIYAGTIPDDDPAFLAVTAVGPGLAGTRDIWTILYTFDDGEFVEEWDRDYGNVSEEGDAFEDIPVDIEFDETANGEYVGVVGRSEGDSTGDDFVTIVYETSNGFTYMEERFNSGSDNDDRPVGLEFRSVKIGNPTYPGVCVAGTAGKSTGDEYVAMIYHRDTGNFLQYWPKYHAVSGRYCVAASMDAGYTITAFGPESGDIYVTGTSIPHTPGGTGNNYETAKFSIGSGSSAQWSAGFNNGLYNGDDYGVAIGVVHGGCPARSGKLSPAA